jgi:CBS domain-containing protein
VRLEDIMRPPVHVTPDTPARLALKILLENKMPGVPEETTPASFKEFTAKAQKVIDSAKWTGS